MTTPLGRADEVAMSNGEVRYSRAGKIATVIFDRPAAHNAMTWQMYEQLDAACARIRAEHDVRVAVFRGAGGKAFVAGTDIAQFQQFRSAEDGLAMKRRWKATSTPSSLSRCPHWR
jgi:enoyl-CoA hydratase/carnithine racemase